MLIFVELPNPDLQPTGELQTELSKLASSRTDYEDIANMSTFLQEQPTAIPSYDEQLVRQLIEKVTVYEGKFSVEFKSGVTVDVDE